MPDQFTIDPSKLLELIDPKNPILYAQLGKSVGLATQLQTDLNHGLSSKDDFEHRKTVFGSNALPEPVSKSLLQFMWEALHDKTLIVLMGAATLEIAAGIYKFSFAPVRDPLELIDGGAIIVAGILTKFRSYDW